MDDACRKGFANLFFHGCSFDSGQAVEMTGGEQSSKEEFNCAIVWSVRWEWEGLSITDCPNPRNWDRDRLAPSHTHLSNWNVCTFLLWALEALWTTCLIHPIHANTFYYALSICNFASIHHDSGSETKGDAANKLLSQFCFIVKCWGHVRKKCLIILLLKVIQHIWFSATSYSKFCHISILKY